MLCQALRDGKYLRRNGRVWIVERNRRVAQLDAAQYGMLLACYTDTDGQSRKEAMLSDSQIKQNSEESSPVSKSMTDSILSVNQEILCCL